MKLQAKEPQNIKKIFSAWTALSQHVELGVIRNEAQYDRMVELMHKLFDQVGEDEDHALARLLEIVGTLIGQYDETKRPHANAQPVDVLKLLMREHGLKQADLKGIIGSQGVVSEILNGKRVINVRQAKALAERFHVSAAAFL